jgi:hypothetical protein
MVINNVKVSSTTSSPPDGRHGGEPRLAMVNG